MNFGDLSLYDAVIINRSLKARPELQAKVKKILLMELIEGQYDIYGVCLSVEEWSELIEALSVKDEIGNSAERLRKLRVIRYFAGREPISSAPVSPSPQP